MLTWFDVLQLGVIDDEHKALVEQFAKGQPLVDDVEEVEEVDEVEELEEVDEVELVEEQIR